MGFFKKMGRFLHRQAKTKTGKLGLVTLGAVGFKVAGLDVPVEAIDKVVTVIGDPGNALYALGAMYVRDNLKKEVSP